PILDHRHHPRRMQFAQHPPEVVDVALQRVPARVARLVAAAEADVVGRDHPVARREPADELAIEIAPGRVAVHQQEGERRIARPFVDYRHADALIDRDQPALPGEAAAEVGPHVEAGIDAHRRAHDIIADVERAFIVHHAGSGKAALNVVTAAVGGRARVVFARDAGEMIRALEESAARGERAFGGWSFYSPDFAAAAEALRTVKAAAPPATH